MGKKLISVPSYQKNVWEIISKVEKPNGMEQYIGFIKIEEDKKYHVSVWGEDDGTEEYEIDEDGELIYRDFPNPPAEHKGSFDTWEEAFKKISEFV